VLINGNSNNNPKEFKLYQNYPNPFNPVTTLSFDLPKDIDIDLKVYDILGKEVYKIDEFRKAGLNKIYFDGNNLSSGIYYYTLSAGSFKATRKMILVK
jgi:hypothetical protein